MKGLELSSRTLDLKTNKKKKKYFKKVQKIYGKHPFAIFPKGQPSEDPKRDAN